MRSVVLIAFTVSAISYAAPPAREGSFYFGSDDFWTMLPCNGVCETQHDHATYDRRKIAWFASWHAHDLKFVVWVRP
jgi:hypothetical protein